jgi:hypothetical protein
MTVAYRDYPLTGRAFLFRRNAFSNTLITGCVQCIGRINGLAVAYPPSVARPSGVRVISPTEHGRHVITRTENPGNAAWRAAAEPWLDQAHSGITDDTRTELRFYPTGEWRNGRSEPIMVGKYGLTVKPSATPSVVRIHHLPPPAKAAPDQAKRGQGLSPYRGQCSIP